MKRQDMRHMRGSVYVNNGYWCYEVRLPGEMRRRRHALCAPGSSHAMRADRPRELALECAHRVWEAATRQERHAPLGCTVNDLCDAYIIHLDDYYRGSGEAQRCVIAVRYLREAHGARHVNELVHTDLLRVRDAMIRRGLARTTINGYMAIITNRMMPWAFDEGHVNAATKAEMSRLVPLKAGRSAARECARVTAVTDDAIRSTQAAMMPNMADMVSVHRLTGMRPDEICNLHWDAIDTSSEPWIYRPAHHKNDWRGDMGQPRVVLIGPRAREILSRHRGTQYPFSPVAAVAEMMQAKRAARTSKFYPCRDENYSRKKENVQRKLREHWETQEYTRSIQAACERAGVAKWCANQLRHALATEIRRKYGLAVAGAVLGHSMGARVTDRYSFEAAEDEIIRLAAPAVEEVG